MWPLVATLLLGSWRLGSTQLLFKNIRSVNRTNCNETVTIPCYINNLATDNIKELYVKWIFKGKVVFSFDGYQNKSSTSNDFSSAKIKILKLLKGDASLHMDKDDAKVGNYTCEATELSREGETTVELKYHSASWFSSNEYILIVTFPIVSILLFWGRLGFIMFKYKPNLMDKKIIIMSVDGLLLIIIVITGVLLFTPGEYSKRKVYGLHFLVSPLVILVLLQFYSFTAGTGITTYVVTTLSGIQLLGYILGIVGLYLCASACVAVHGHILILGLVIIAVVELLGLVYMIFMEHCNIPKVIPGSRHYPDTKTKEGSNQNREPQANLPNEHRCRNPP